MPQCLLPLRYSSFLAYNRMGAQKCVSNSAVVPNVRKCMFSRAWQGARVALLSSDNYSPNPRKRNEEEERDGERATPRFGSLPAKCGAGGRKANRRTGIKRLSSRSPSLYPSFRGQTPLKYHFNFRRGQAQIENPISEEDKVCRIERWQNWFCCGKIVPIRFCSYWRPH